MLLILIFLIVILVKFYPKFDPSKAELVVYKQGSYSLKLLIFAIWVVLFVFVVRGTALRPCSLLTANEYTSTHNLPLIVNTPFTIIQTIDKDDLAPVKYLNTRDIERQFSPVIKFRKDGQQFKKVNVVIIILESFSKEYIDFFGAKKGLTPFLDSLLNNSLSFKYSFANGKKSMEAIPSILASIPVLMDNPFITSQYSFDKINSLASLLKKEGYNTSFFHGGLNGTMGFDNFSRIAEFDNYYGKNEYNNDKDYDGKWGIFDEEFLQFFASKLNTFKPPFISSVFTLSSHHPYKLPPKYPEGKFKGKTDFEKSINYTDFSLRKFFNTASHMSWYENTMFVISADHTSSSTEPFFLTQYGNYCIPIFYFTPGDSSIKGRSGIITEQVDIMPSILDYLNYSKPFISFGKSVFDSLSTHYAVQYINGNYQLISGDHILMFNGEKSTALFNFKSDNMLYKNILSVSKATSDSLEIFLKAFIQTFNSRMIDNKMTLR